MRWYARYSSDGYLRLYFLLAGMAIARENWWFFVPFPLVVFALWWLERERGRAEAQIEAQIEAQKVRLVAGLRQQADAMRRNGDTVSAGRLDAQADDLERWKPMNGRHTCAVCGKTSSWEDGWAWYGSYLQAEAEPHTIEKTCSVACRKKFVPSEAGKAAHQRALKQVRAIRYPRDNSKPKWC